LCQGDQEEEIVDANITEENKLENERKVKWTKNAFGSCDQPVLEKVKFTVSDLSIGSRFHTSVKNHGTWHSHSTALSHQSCTVVSLLIQSECLDTVPSRHDT
jgi:hypothetical protein